MKVFLGFLTHFLYKDDKINRFSFLIFHISLHFYFVILDKYIENFSQYIRFFRHVIGKRTSLCQPLFLLFTLWYNEWFSASLML